MVLGCVGCGQFFGNSIQQQDCAKIAAAAMELTLRQLAFIMWPTLRQFVFIVVAIIMLLFFLGFILEELAILLPSSLATALDTATGGSPPLMLKMNSSNYSTTIKARVQNTTAMPLLCRDIIPLDAVANISVAAICSKWCHEALGPNSAAPYMLSPWHVFWLLKSERGHIYLTCWKAQTAAWALELMPELYWIYLLAMVYGVWSIIAFLWTFCTTEPQTIPGGPAQDHVTPDGPYGRRCGDIPCCCLPVRSNQALPLENGWNEAPLCYPASSDRNGSEIGLKIAAFFILFEPFGDIVSVLTILRIGQPFPAAFMAFGIALACTVSGDPLQLSGAHAVAESLRKGFETRALMHYKDHELWESWICATVQVYSLMFLHPKTAKLSTGLNLLVSASVNLAISIPAQKQATYVIGELKDSDWTFATIQEAKRSPALRCQKVVTTLGIVLTASMAILFQKVRPGGDLNMEPFWFGELWPILCDPETWQQWLLALVVICFRVPCDCLLLICYIFGIFGCPWHAIAISVAMMLGATFGATYRIDRFPSDGRSNSQTDGLPLLDAESPLISSRFSCLKCEDSQSSEESSEE